jgi:hypothetical protein
MTERYEGRVCAEGPADALYVDVSISDLDAGNWIGVSRTDNAVLGTSELGTYRVKLLDQDHPRCGQAAQATIVAETDHGELRLVGHTPFE